jgi:hypothetical protein
MGERGRLRAALLVPVAAPWVAWMERRILARGEPLPAGWLAAARDLGLRAPERVRLHFVPELPGRLPAWLRHGLVRAGALPAHLAGMALGYGILIRADRRGDRLLLLHELAHTAQYERLGGIRPFLRCYLKECCGVGYQASALEEEANALARRHGAALAAGPSRPDAD